MGIARDGVSDSGCIRKPLPGLWRSPWLEQWEVASATFSHPGAFVSLGCHARTLYTRRLKCRYELFFFTVLEAGCGSVWLLVRVLFLIDRWLLSCVLPGQDGGKGRRERKGWGGKERGREEREALHRCFFFFIFHLFLPALGLGCSKGAPRCFSRALPSCCEWGLLSSCGVQASGCGGFSCCGHGL